MSQTLQNQIMYAKSMSGVISLSDGAGSIITNGEVITNNINTSTFTASTISVSNLFLPRLNTNLIPIYGNTINTAVLLQNLTFQNSTRTLIIWDDTGTGPIILIDCYNNEVDINTLVMNIYGGILSINSNTTFTNNVIIPRVNPNLTALLGSSINLTNLCQSLFYDGRFLQIWNQAGTIKLFDIDCVLNTIKINGATTFYSSITLLDNTIANGLTITPIEIGYLDGLTSNIQTQLNSIIASMITLSGNNSWTGTNSFSNTTTFTGNIIANSLTITPTEFGYLDGATSNIQSQLANTVTLNTTQSITGTKTMNDLLPIFSTSITSYKMGTNSMQYQQATSTNNIAWGTNALRGKSTIPANNVSKRNICIGDNTGANMQDSPCDDNVIIGYNAGRTMFYQSQQSVIIGSNAYGLNAWSLRNVIIGYNAVGTGTNQNTDCVVVGSNCGISLSGKSNVVCMGAGNGLLSNSFTVIGSFNLSSAILGNRVTILGNQNLINMNFDAFSCAIGNENGSNQTTGFYNIYIGQFCNVASSNILNSATIGLSSTIPRSHCLYLGASTADSITYQNVCVAFKNTLKSVKPITSSTSYDILFEDEETINITVNTITSINLPLPNSASGTVKNVGATFNLIKNYTNPIAITINAPSGQTIRLSDGTTSATYIWSALEINLTVCCIANSSTSWGIINSQSSSGNVICSDLYIGGLSVYSPYMSKLINSNGALSTPLAGLYYWAGAANQNITLPIITTDMLGARVVVRRTGGTNTTFTITCGTGDLIYGKQGTTTFSAAILLTATPTPTLAYNGEFVALLLGYWAVL